MNYGTYAEIDLSAIQNNIEVVRKATGNTRIMMVLKANAYGHGAVETMHAIKECGVADFAVATFFEAMELRRADADISLTVLGYIPPDFIAQTITNRIAITVFSEEYWQTVKDGAASAGMPFDVQIKINSGFNRLGFDATDDALAVIQDIGAHPLASIKGAFSHLALAGREADETQCRIFMDFADRIENGGVKIPCRHIADSISALVYDWARMDMVRLGAVAYGLKAGYPVYDTLDLRPSMTLYSTISQVRRLKKGEGISYDYTYVADRDITVGTVTCGYADGLPRGLSNKGFLLIRGKKAPLLGLICMDQCVVDLSEIPDAKIGDEVTIFDIDTNSPVAAADIAPMLKTNKNDLVAGVTKRVTRIYKKHGELYKTTNELLAEGDL